MLIWPIEAQLEVIAVVASFTIFVAPSTMHLALRPELAEVVIMPIEVIDPSRQGLAQLRLVFIVTQQLTIGLLQVQLEVLYFNLDIFTQVGHKHLHPQGQSHRSRKSYQRSRFDSRW